MSHRVVALHALPGRSRRVRVELDPEAPLLLDRNVAAGLELGQRLNSLDLERLREEDQVEQAVQWAVRLIARRPRSEAEIRQGMKRKRLAQPLQDTVLARLDDEGWLDDRKFAAFWVENRDTFRPRGARALRAELRQKGLSAEVIEQALDSHDEQAAAIRAGSKAARRWQAIDAATFEQRLTAHLVRRGFDYTTSASTARRLWEEAGWRGEEKAAR